MSFFKKKKIDLPKREPLNSDAVYLSELIEETERELLKLRVTEAQYQEEHANPKHMSKTQAEENLVLIQKRIRYQQEQIEIYWQYAEDHNIELKHENI